MLAHAHTGGVLPNTGCRVLSPCALLMQVRHVKERLGQWAAQHVSHAETRLRNELDARVLSLVEDKHRALEE